MKCLTGWINPCSIIQPSELSCCINAAWAATETIHDIHSFVPTINFIINSLISKWFLTWATPPHPFPSMFCDSFEWSYAYRRRSVECYGLCWSNFIGGLSGVVTWSCPVWGWIGTCAIPWNAFCKKRILDWMCVKESDCSIRLSCPSDYSDAFPCLSVC